MGGLREKKKQEAYRNILEAGTQMFSTQGYDNTTMEQLAEKAGIGVGTIYNHFKTKADVFLSIISEDIALEDGPFHLDAKTLESGAADIIWQFIARHLHRLRSIGKRIFREVLFAMMSSMKSDSSFIQRLAKLDYAYIARLEELMETLKAKGLLHEGFDSKSASMVTYSIVFIQAMLYAVDEVVGFQEFENAVRTQVLFSLRGNINGKGENG